jgi:CheY-like chemotaxis protein
VAPADQEMIFEEFTQVDTPLQRKQKGTGLGLPLTRKLARLLGGHVGMQSTPGLGSTFWAEIPIRFGGADKVMSASDRQVPGPASEARTLRILVVDDDETARYTVSTFATRPDTEVITAENGMAGIARAQTEHPDVILLDLMMPGIGGHEVLQRLKSDAATASIPVVIVTSRFVNEAEREEILARAVSILYKGDLTREAVTAAIDAALAH